jgi:hypothetical protein
MLVKKVPFPTPTEKRRQQPGTHCNQHHSITLRPLIDEDQWLRTTLIDKAFKQHEEIQVIDRLIVHQFPSQLKKQRTPHHQNLVMGSLCFKKICLGTKNLKKFFRMRQKAASGLKAKSFICTYRFDQIGGVA